LRILASNSCGGLPSPGISDQILQQGEKKMLVARIITRTPQDAVAACEYLCSQGYTVETVSPEEFRITPADLELRLERCSPTEALERARALVESGAAPAAPSVTGEVAAINPQKPEKIAITYDTTGRPVEFAEQGEVERRQRPSSLWSALGAMLRRGQGEVLSALASAWQSLKRPAVDLRRRHSEQRMLKLQTRLAREREEIRRGEELARVRVRQAVELRQRMDSERQRQEQIFAEQEQARGAAPQESVSAPQASAEPHEVPVPVNSPEPEPVPVAALTAKSLPAPAESGLLRPMPVLVRRRRPIVISRAAVASACGLSLLVLLGFVAYANRRPAAPLGSGALGDVKQDVPFGTATITPPSVSKPAAAPPASKRSPVMRHANQKLPGRRLGSQARQPLPADSQEDDEVVVRHYMPPSTKPQPSTAKLKQHSDLD